MTTINFSTAASWITTGEVSNFIKCLKNREINVEESDDEGQTLLMIACQKGIEIISDQLIEMKADVNAEDYDSWSPLLHACKGGFFNIAAKLIISGAKIDHRDVAGWTGLMWCCYKGYTELARYLLDHNANPNVADQYNISCLAWASGRGHNEILNSLLAAGAKVNVGDKYGATPLVWASRKGYTDIVRALLNAGAHVDTAGMHSWTALIVASRGNFSDIVNLLLEHRPNVNSVDRESCTALTVACKEGYTEIATALISSGASINLPDRNGDTNLIHAAKGGHLTIVDALLRKYADVDIQGTDGKTALYWASEKNHVDVCRLILKCDANVDICTKDGDTPLMKATRNRNLELVQMLVDKKAKVSAVDKQGDTALHIAMRARSKAIVEVLLRNPRNSQLLYRPNRAGETPYNIDTAYQKSILAHIFGARRLNTNEDTENMLGYDLYSSALADILSEPALSMPICTGLYAKWGSGKSFLLGKLEGELSNFTFQNYQEPTLKLSSYLVLGTVALVSLSLGFFISLATWHWILGMALALALFFLTYLFLGVIHYGMKKHDWSWGFSLSIILAGQFARLHRFLQVLFCHPPTHNENDYPVRFVFINQTKVSSSPSDDETEVSPVCQIVVELHKALEKQFGFFTTRFCRALKPKPSNTRKIKYRTVCCIPAWALSVIGLSLIYGCVVLAMLYAKQLHGAKKDPFIEPSLLTIGALLLASLAVVSGHLFKIASSLLISHHRRIFHGSGSASCHTATLKKEVDAITNVVRCMDGFSNQQTRLVVIVDGLDSCEAIRVLKVLDSLHVLLSSASKSPFVLVLALDPHIIIKAVDGSPLSSRTVSGHDYLRNIVHLPFYLQNSGLRRVMVAQQTAAKRSAAPTSLHEDASRDTMNTARKSSNSSIMTEAIGPGRKIPPMAPGGRAMRLKASESISSSINNLTTGGGHRAAGASFGPQDLTRVLLTDDYFSDINPRSMRRLLNIIYITGRLLKAFKVDFEWFRLAAWVNLTERWPYRTSWILVYFELHETELEESIPLRAIYDRVKAYFPPGDPSMGLDHDERKLEVMLTFHSTSLLVADLKIFLPFTIHLDPYIRKFIQEENQHVMDVLKEMRPSGFAPRDGKAKSQSVALKIPSKPTSILAPVPNIETPSKSYHAAEAPLLSIPPTPKIPSVPYKKLVSVGKEVSLSNLSAEEVCHYLGSRIERLDRARLPTYQAAILHHNINGLVLATCDLSELRPILSMAFGDWELFKLHILALRDQEASAAKQQEEAESYRLLPSNEVATQSCRLLPGPSSILEKQVTLEESMLYGALETLNEESRLESGAKPLETCHHTASTGELGVLYLPRSPRSDSPHRGPSLSGSMVDMSSKCSQPNEIIRDCGSPSLGSSPSISSHILTASGSDSRCGGELLQDLNASPIKNSTGPLASPQGQEDSPSDDEHTPLVSPAHVPMVPLVSRNRPFSFHRSDVDPSSPSTHKARLERQYSIQIPLEHPASNHIIERPLRPSHSMATPFPNPPHHSLGSPEEQERLIGRTAAEEFAMTPNETIL